MDLFSQAVAEYIRCVAYSFSSSEGYFVSCLLASTGFLVGRESLVVTAEQSMPLNLYSVVTWPPTTGKLLKLFGPLITIRNDTDMGNFLLERCTSSAMIKCISEQNKVVFVSPEIYGILNKLLKMMRTMQLVKFSYYESCFQESVLHTAMPRNAPKKYQSILLGLTPVSYGVRLLCRLDDQESGFLFLFPVFESNTRTTKEARQKLELHVETFKSITDFFLEIQELHHSKKNYSYTSAANDELNATDENFIKELNESLLRGELTPKLKIFDII